MFISQFCFHLANLIFIPLGNHQTLKYFNYDFIAISNHFVAFNSPVFSIDYLRLIGIWGILDL